MSKKLIDLSEIEEEKLPEDEYTKYDGKVVVYVLALQQGKFYVGLTSNLRNRIFNHMNNISPVVWVNKYPYVALEHVYSFEEDDCTHFIEKCNIFPNGYGT